MQATVRAAGAVLLAAASLAAQAQPIYRCGNAYGTQPCADGRAIGADPQAAPTAAERSQAAANARRDAHLADTLQKERLRAESQSAGNAFYVPPPAFEPERPAPYKTPEKAATRKLDVFTASVPGSAPPKKVATAKDKAPPQPVKAPASVQAVAPPKATAKAH